MENAVEKEKLIMPMRKVAYDWLKLIGALLVVVGHYYAMLPAGDEMLLWRKNGLCQKVVMNGGYAIILFFAISGYMLMEHHCKNGEMTFHEYITPKILRLWPLHFITMLFCFVVQQIRIAKGLDFFCYQANSITDLIVGSFFGGHLVTPELSLNGPSWTMSVTFFCYIVFYVSTKYDKTIKRNAVFLAAAIFNSYDLYMVLSGRNSGVPYIIDSVQYSAAFFVGCLIYEVCRMADNNRNIKRLLDRGSVLVISFFTVLFIFSAEMKIWGSDGYTFFNIYVIAPLLLYWCRNNKINRILQKIPVTPGKLYFPIYLLHFPIMLLAETVSQIKNQSINWASISVFVIYMLILISCSKIVSILLNKIKI